LQVEEHGTHKSKGARHILQVLLTPGTLVVRDKEGAIDEIRFKDILRCEPHESTDGEPTALRLQVSDTLSRAADPNLSFTPPTTTRYRSLLLHGVETLAWVWSFLFAQPALHARSYSTHPFSLFVFLPSRLAPGKPNRHGLPKL
jgi:hypothetical protein